MNHKYIFLLLIIGFCFSITTAQDYLPHKQNTDFTLSVTSNNATACNLSSIQYSDGTSIIYNLALTKDGQLFYKNISYNNYSLMGSICHNIICGDGSSLETGSVCRDVTPTGNSELGSGQGLTLLGSLFLIIIIAIFFLVIGGNVESPAWKIVMIGLSVVMFIIAILFTLVNLTQNLGGFADIIDGYSTFWRVITYIVSLGMLALILLSMWWAWMLWQRKRGLAD